MLNRLIKKFALSQYDVKDNKNEIRLISETAIKK